jgi:hypothetical protein
MDAGHIDIIRNFAQGSSLAFYVSLSLSIFREPLSYLIPVI